MVIPNLKFSKMGGYSRVFGHPKSEVFQKGGYSGLQFQKGVNWRIWTKIYCSARNLLVHHSSLSHTMCVETNNGNDFLSITWNRITLGGPAHEILTRTMSNPGFDQGGLASEAGSCQHSGVESHK